MKSGYFKTMDQIFEIDGLGHSDIVVYAFLCRAANKQGESWYGLRSMSAKCKMSKTTLIKAIKTLAEKGLVLVERGRTILNKYGKRENITNLYRVVQSFFKGDTNEVTEGQHKEGKMIDIDEQFNDLLEKSNLGTEQKEEIIKKWEMTKADNDIKHKIAYIGKVISNTSKSSQSAYIEARKSKSGKWSSNSNSSKQSTFKTPGVMNAYGQLSAMSEEDRKAALAIAGW